MKQFNILLLACELEELKNRITKMYDLNHGFNDPTKVIQTLEREIYNKRNKGKSGANTDVFWEAEPDMDSKVEHFKNAFMR